METDPACHRSIFLYDENLSSSDRARPSSTPSVKLFPKQTTITSKSRESNHLRSVYRSLDEKLSFFDGARPSSTTFVTLFPKQYANVKKSSVQPAAYSVVSTRASHPPEAAGHQTSDKFCSKQLGHDDSRQNSEPLCSNNYVPAPDAGSLSPGGARLSRRFGRSVLRTTPDWTYRKRAPNGPYVVVFRHELIVLSRNSRVTKTWAKYTLDNSCQHSSTTSTSAA
eukprot:Plantae.Rhodophyta-Rhodochaete_pulchella.ctg13173.p1 GENE.Plantae.Rhodophyta-Rhodochaete_pulchella.ctg13173~~Plantae.Rhodophyta-Rhodochaete_pulchella.ctg13173.p1  ORF type:complete len:224 (-),score=5.14 Plantae.Rhodophyta-Rhodochaete_pulchella.ctg13173:484-1155(-)